MSADDAVKAPEPGGTSPDWEQRAHRFEAERDAAWIEAHHRIKNNLHFVGSMLNLQRNRLKDPIAQSELDAAVDRIAVLGRVQSRLYTDRHQKIDLQGLMTELCADLASSLIMGRAIRLVVDIPDLEASPDKAVPIGLILNELATNAFEHGFPAARAGQIKVVVERLGEQECRLTVIDDGVGLDPARLKSGCGLQIVRIMVAQLHGELNFVDAEPGTRVEIRFALD